MYIQITSRCNMKCAHCCGDYGVKGVDMTRDMFIAAAELAEDHGEYVTIGGGEPTLHPLFWDFIGIALGYQECKGSVCVITNGSVTGTATRLANLARAGVIGAELSQDRYHSAIDPYVVQVFTRERGYGEDHNDFRGIRTVRTILNLGRAAENGIGTEDDCSCDDLFARSDGTLWACAHEKVQFGTVFKPEIPEGYFGSDYKCSEKANQLDRMWSLPVEEEEEMEQAA